MKLTVIGCGDAFASGGRNNTCFHLKTAGTQLLLDCGATSFVAMKRMGMAPQALDTIVLTHFHGDHYGGVPFFLLDAMVSKRTRPLTIVSPPGGKERMAQLMESMYVGLAAQIGSTFEVHYYEYQHTQKITVGTIDIQPFPVIHSPTSLPHGVRITANDKVLAFSGDTEWTDTLIPLADQSDLFICDCNFYDKDGPSHVSYRTLETHFAELRTRRMVLTHLGEEMIAHARELDKECLEDGQVLIF